MAELSTVQWVIFSVVWLAGSFGTAALLALLYKRLHPGLSFYKLWALWSVVVSVVAVIVLAAGWI